MTRHSYTPLPPSRSFELAWGARTGLLCLGAVATVLFSISFYPGSPVHAPSMSTLMRHGRGSQPLAAGPRAPGAQGAAAAPAATTVARPSIQPRPQPQPQKQPAPQPPHKPQQQQLKEEAKQQHPKAPAAAPPQARAAPKPAPAADVPSVTPAAALGRAAAAPPGKVLLELFVMSHCPDARFCEVEIDKLLEKLHPIAHLRSHYIQKSRGGGVTCPHGDAECLGNRMQLCVQEHTPPAHNRGWFSKFLVCMARPGADVASEAAVKACLDEVGASGAPRAAMDACIDGAQGAALMKRSADTTAARGVARSCTVAVEGQKRCVRDGGRWYDCPGGSSEAELAATICAAYRKKAGRDADACTAAAAAAAPAAAAAAGAAAPAPKPH
ncbi:MAG: hypothetical protein J3K34DRAFT_111189 [Monoraphidium minutum]|nr:MAG: hypothetical protein J3K34DRAFT_111189 [Monoraphidium minutum]